MSNSFCVFYLYVQLQSHPLLNWLQGEYVVSDTDPGLEQEIK